jgi:hypothetical protein
MKDQPWNSIELNDSRQGAIDRYNSLAVSIVAGDDTVDRGQAHLNAPEEMADGMRTGK